MTPEPEDTEEEPQGLCEFCRIHGFTVCKDTIKEEQEDE